MSVGDDIIRRRQPQLLPLEALAHARRSKLGFGALLRFGFIRR
jgi:hypothetical protein